MKAPDDKPDTEDWRASPWKAGSGSAAQAGKAKAAASRITCLMLMNAPCNERPSRRRDAGGGREI